VTQLNTSYSYRFAVLLGSSFVIFEVVFLTLYVNDFWFSFDLSAWGIVAISLAVLAAHFLLCFIESPLGCRLARPLKHGLPLIFYRRWTAIDEDNMRIGSRQMLWQSMNKLHLTIFGNLKVWSDRLAGKGHYDLILSLPFNCARRADQQRFIDAAQKGSLQLALSPRLKHYLGKKELRSTYIAQIISMAVMVVLLLDLGRGSFAFLEILKNYYLAQTETLKGHAVQAAQHLAEGDVLLSHQSPFSWINTKLFKDGLIAAVVHKARSEALWELGRKQEALSEAELAVKLNPHSFRLNLHEARILDSLGKQDQAHEQLLQAVKNRSDLLLPRLYLLSWLHAHETEQDVRSYYQTTLNDLKDQVFEDDPSWPPGGNHFLPETIYQEDLQFVLDRLLQGH
jgi:tetratricopeptide (TPR) repeat protein